MYARIRKAEAQFQTLVENGHCTGNGTRALVHLDCIKIAIFYGFVVSVSPFHRSVQRALEGIVRARRRGFRH